VPSPRLLLCKMITQTLALCFLPMYRSPGVEAVRVALERQWTVTAYCREEKQDKLAAFIENPKFTLVLGDAMDKESITPAVKGHDACLVLLGCTGLVADKVSSVGTKHIIKEMKEVGMKKLVVVSAMGVGDSEAHCPPVT